MESANSEDTGKNIKALYVAGRFDDDGGKPSKIGEQVFNEVKHANVDYHNGGPFKELEQVLEHIRDYQLIYWFGDVPNSKPKLVQEIKRRNKACVLVTSKRNLREKYSFQDIIYHALGIKSNLLVEISKKKERYNGRVVDPLGNVFLDYNYNFGLVGKVLEKRVNELLSFTRIGSESIGDKIEVPDEKQFFKLIKKYAGKFHKLIHAHPKAANRFFGNASFRCERGFPSFKVDNLIFASKRNVDKRAIHKDGFVGVKQEIPVKYFGDQKPSVDTPIQVRLYDHYQNVKYMLHSHTYVKNAPFTNKVVPCGAVEEGDEIISVFPDKDESNFSVNLKGHGSLVLVDEIEHLKKIHYIARKMPETHLDYANNL